jgi:two-component system, NarL family, sensor kinase
MNCYEAAAVNWHSLLDLATGPFLLLLLATALFFLFVFYQRRIKKFNAQLLALEKKQQQLLLDASLRYQEEERKKLSANLHDDAGPLLATARLYLNDQLLEQNKDTQAQTIAMARSILDEAIELVRSISHDLIPPTLKNFGLHSAINDLVKKINGAGVVTATATFTSYEKRFSEEKEMIVYRIVLELLNNILKHSHATFIDIEQLWHQQQYRLLISHDGEGLTQQAFEQLNNQPGGMGLKNIAGRIRLLEGSIQFEKELNKEIYAIKISVA